MALDHLIAKARDHFNIETPEDWQRIRPEWVRQAKGVGPKTLDHIRLYLAARGLTLKDDATPDFWNKNLQVATIGGQVAMNDTAETESFTILIDQQEKQPWTFQGFRRNGRPIIQPFLWRSLGPSRGDYTIAGLEDHIGVERKSVPDAVGTFLSHGPRGDAWQNTLKHLAGIPSGHVVIEGTIATCVHSIQSRGQRSREAMVNEFIGSVQSWIDTYRVPFHFLDSRRLAEDWARRLLRRAWRKQMIEMPGRQSSQADNFSW